MILRKKYRQLRKDLIKDLVSKDNPTAILAIELKGVSKIQGHYIYEVNFLDNGVEKTIPVIAIDISQVLAKLEPHVNLGIPATTMKWMLGSERNINNENTI